MTAAPRDFVGWLRDLLHERTGLEGERLDAIEAELRREFGGREVYVHRRIKRERLAALATQPPEATTGDKARAAGISKPQARRYLNLLR